MKNKNQINQQLKFEGKALFIKKINKYKTIKTKNKNNRQLTQA